MVSTTGEATSKTSVATGNKEGFFSQLVTNKRAISRTHKLSILNKFIVNTTVFILDAFSIEKVSGAFGWFVCGFNVYDVICVNIVWFMCVGLEFVGSKTIPNTTYCLNILRFTR